MFTRRFMLVATFALVATASAQDRISDYRINGEQLFYPNANDPNA